MVFHYANTEQKDKELKTYKEMLSMFPDDPTALNSYAWRMAEIEMNLEQMRAMENNINIKVGLCDSKPLSVDTEEDLIKVSKEMK